MLPFIDVTAVIPSLSSNAYECCKVLTDFAPPPPFLVTIVDAVSDL